MKKVLSLFALVLGISAFSSLLAQNTTTLRFTGKGRQGAYVQLSSVEVKNLTRGWEETLVYPDTILMLGNVGLEDHVSISRFALSQNTPNPFRGSTDFSLQMPEADRVSISVFDINGKKITDLTQDLTEGIHIFRVILNTPQTYIVTAKTEYHSATIKIINQGSEAYNRVVYLGRGSGSITYEMGGNKNLTTNHDFEPGDLMSYVGKYVANGVEYTSDTILQPQYESQDFQLVFQCVPLNINMFSATTCDAFTWNGQTYTQTGTYTQTFQGTDGCDSVVTLNLTVQQPVSSTVSVTVCGSYAWNGQTYTQSGTYTQTFQGANGCDSVVTLNLTVNQPTSSELSATTCGSFTWNGQTLTQSGTYTQTLQSVNGCDSVATLHLTITPPVTNSIAASSCGSYVWNGQTLTQSGTYTQTLQSVNGCDSVVTLNLTVNQPVTHSFAATSCGGYVWNGQTYTQSGSYTQTLQTVNGCDSVVTLNLTVNQTVTHSFAATSCGSYVWNGQTYTQSGSYTQTLQSVSGCDSVVTLNLTVNQPVTAAITETVCGGYVWNGQTYVQSGTYTQIFQGANGCDSTVTLNLTVNQPVTNVVAETVCGGYVWNGQTYVQSGTYTQTFQAANGCDSVVTLNLTVNQPVAHSFAATSCGSYVWNGQTYTQSGVYTQTLQSVSGCDSVVTLNLTVNQPITTAIAETVCGGYVWNGQTYVQSGTYTQTFQAANGCDSVVTLNLTVNQASLPVLSDMQVYEVGTHTANVTAIVQADSCSTVLSRGFCWSTSTYPTLVDNHLDKGSGMGEFTDTITGLSYNTTYHVRAYATSEAGIAYSENMTFTTQFPAPVVDEKSCTGTPTVTDVDGNVYNTVKIGNQCWMRENLRTTHYADGTAIPVGTSTSYTEPYYYDYSSSSFPLEIRGYFYNWPAAMHGSVSSNDNPSGVQGICPAGWHLPSRAEWNAMESYVSSQSEYTCGGETSHIAKALASTEGWNNCSGECYPGDQSAMANNATGFSAVPAGGRFYSFSSAGNATDFWSSTEYSSSCAYRRHLSCDDAVVSKTALDKNCARSVRCLRDSLLTASVPSVTTSAISSVGTTSATCGGNVTSDGDAIVTTRGICWSTSPTPTLADNHTDDGGGTGEFTSTILGLTAGTTYYVRAYATNSVGTAYGEVLTFTTDSYLSFAFLVDTPCTSDSVPVSHSTEVLEYCVGTDSVRLSIGNYEYGIVQWQVSHDTVEWTNIKDANDTFYVFYPEESGYYRARMTYNQCPSEYSQTIHLHLIPRADAGRDRVLNADYSAQLFGNEFEDATGLWTVLSGDSAVIDDPTDPYALFQGPDSLYVLTWTLTNSCGSSTDTVTLRFIHTVLADHIVVVDTTDLILSDSAEMANGIYRIVFNYPVPTIVDSTILVGIPNGGFLRKVMAFEQQGDTVEMYTQQATLDDLIEEGAFNFDGSVLNSPAVSPAKGPKAPKGYARMDHQPTRAELAENPDFLDGRVWYYEYPLECSASDGSKSASLKFPFLPGSVDTNFTPSLKITNFHASPDFVTDFDFFKTNGGVHTYYLNQFRMPVSFILKLKASFSVHTDIYEFEKDIFTIKKPVLFMIGVVPVEITAKYQLVGGLEGDAELSVQKTWSVTGEVVIGHELRYDDGVVTLNVSKPFQGFHAESVSPWTVNASAEFSFSVKNKISLELYGCLGPYAEIGPKMNLKSCFPLTSAENASTEFTFDIPWKIGVSMKVLKRKIFDLEYKDVFDKIYEKKNPERLEKCTIAPQNYDMGGGVYHPVSFKVYGDLSDFLMTKLKVHVHCSSGHIEGYSQAFQPGHTWNKTTIDTMVSAGQLVDIYWKPDGVMPAVVEVYVYDCDGKHIDGSPIICFATVGNNPCLQSNLQLSVVNGQLQASGGQQPYQYSDDGVNYSYMKPTLDPNHTYYVKDLNNCMAQYNNPSVACEIQMDYSLNGGSVAVVVRNGSAPYRFYLDGSSTPFVTSPILSGVTIPLSNGGHTITVVDKNDCTCTVHFTIDDGQSIPTVYVNPTYNTHNNVWNEVQGIVVDDGNLDVTERGIYYSANQNMSSATKVVGPLGQGTGTFLCSVPASVAQSSYYVCAYAVNSRGTGYSDTVLISDHGYSAEVRTDSVFNITANSASGAGTVLSNGTSDDLVVFRGICWNTAGEPTVDDNHTQDEGQGVGSFVDTLTGLAPNTTYYARAYAINLGSIDPAYGDVVTFTTLGGSGSQDGQPCPGTPTVTDYDGNVYNTVQIGEQCWMKENLRTTHFADGTEIPFGNTQSYTKPYCYYPNNNTYNVSLFGYRYNWAAVMNVWSMDALENASSNNNPSGVQGLCPSGWHVPSDIEWTQLSDYVGSQDQFICDNDVNNVAKSLAANSNWHVNDDYLLCSIGTDLNSNNATNFSALPAGGGYFSYGYDACFWTTTIYDEGFGEFPYLRYLSSSSKSLRRRGGWSEYHFLSIRCLRDEAEAHIPSVGTVDIFNINPIYAVCSCRVNGDGGDSVTDRGVCWGTEPSPTITNDHSNAGNGVGEYNAELINLEPNTTYYVRAYATNGIGTAYGQQLSFTTANRPLNDAKPCAGTPTVADFDGNVYQTVQIGSQCWTREHLRSTHYADGIPITMAAIPGIDTSMFSNDERIAIDEYSFGNAYLWFAAVRGATGCGSSPVGLQGVCPNGWHVPSDAECMQLYDYVRSIAEYSCGGSIDVFKALASQDLVEHEDDCYNSCYVYCNPISNNSTGFSLISSFWSASFDSADSVAYCNGWNYSCLGFMCPLHPYGSRYGGQYHYVPARFVRCLRDESPEWGAVVTPPKVTTAMLSDVTETTATCGGIILSDGGVPVTAKGVCWSENENATIADPHTVDGIGMDPFTSNLTNLGNYNLGYKCYYVRAYATNNQGTAYGQPEHFMTLEGNIPPHDARPCSVAPSVTDIDGNVYNTVRIGNQCWMKENLRTTHFPDGTTILLGDTLSSVIPYRYMPNNDVNVVSEYGYLYNYPALFNGPPAASVVQSDVQGICPIGWHLPSAAEWDELGNYIYPYEGACRLSAKYGWNGSEVPYSPGFYQVSNDSYGFSALPAGDTWGRFGAIASFWGKTNCRYIWANDEDFNTGFISSNQYMSIRCVLDKNALLPVVSTSPVSDISSITASCGGIVISNGEEELSARGVCWSISPNPTVSDPHTADGVGEGSYSSSLTGLAAGLTYHVRAYATNSFGTTYGDDVVFTTVGISIPNDDAKPCIETPSVSDIDGNLYNTVKIGNQCWMKENMRTTHYANGSPVTNFYCPNNDMSTITKCGYLYDWSSAIGNAASSSENPSGIQGLCPSGWHVPSNAEWIQLIDYVCGVVDYVCNDNIYPIGKALASTTEWNSSTQNCAIGNDLSANNSTGFNMMPAGWHSSGFNAYGNAAYFISSNSTSSEIVFRNTEYRIGNYHYQGDYSVRCLRDTGHVCVGDVSLPSVTTSTITSISIFSAICGGIVTSDGGAAVTERGVCWSTSPNPTVANDHTSDGAGVGVFSSTIVGLSEGVSYYVRAYASNSEGTTYGNEVSFTAENTIPVTDYGSITTCDSWIYDGGGSLGNYQNYSDGYLVVNPVNEEQGVVLEGTYSIESDWDYIYVYSGEGISGTLLGEYTGSGTISLVNDGVVTIQFVSDGNVDDSGFAIHVTCSGAMKPAVTTASVTNFTATTALCGGDVVHDNGYAVFARGVCWSTSPTPEISDNHTVDGSGVGEFASSIANLIEGVTYYVRAYATNSEGTAYGNEVSFVFSAVPSVENYTLTTCDSWVYDNGGSTGNYQHNSDGYLVIVPATEGEGIALEGTYNTESGYDKLYVYDGEGVSGTLLGEFTGTGSISLSGAGTLTIRFTSDNSVNRAGFAIHATCVGSPVVKPTVITNSVSNITSTSATCGGNVTSDGGDSVTARGVCWGASPNPTIADNHTGDGSGVGTFTSSITGLNSGTTYYVRAYATNSVGTAYGDEISFTTNILYGQPCQGTPTVTDYDGNVYNTVQIGEQCWMRENLRTTHYSDGSAIPTSGNAVSETTPYYYDNISGGMINIPLSARGYLYNWPAAMHGAPSSTAVPSGVQGVCPTGWHLPSDAEWTMMTDYVKSQSEFLCSGDSDYIAKALASTDYWNSYSGECNPGDQSLLTNNTSGFSAVPAGDCGMDFDFWFGNLGLYSYFWTSSQFEGNSGFSYCRYLHSIHASVFRNYYEVINGYSVRCLRDAPIGAADTIFLFQEGFESGSLPAGWTIVDSDGDGNNWYVANGVVHSGNGCVTSASWENNTVLIPDNWLITPAVELSGDATLSFWVVGQDPNWAAEHFSVYLSTTGTAISDFTTTLLYDQVSTPTMTQYTVDLSPYSGQTVYIAFRHHNITDMYHLNLDDVEIYTYSTGGSGSGSGSMVIPDVGGGGGGGGDDGP